ncbi:MIND complex subunit MTW1 [Sporobolomyces salmoneus]|uniref:MIND complex subunit MTW1 n=1 Tax=Sporobolomyces salmoneus TaxID=183962 RepID=UPI003178E267
MAELTELSKSQIKSIKSTILTEHFRFAPESFAKSCFDIANKCLYVASGWLEEELIKLVQAQQEQQKGKGEPVDEEQQEQVQRGCYRLETLLEHEIDKQFDLFEIFMLRNTFNLDEALIPYVQLPHQVRLPPAPLKESHESTLTEYEQELKLYEEELLKQRRLKVVELFLREKEMRLERIKEEIGWLGFGGERNPLHQRTTNLSPSLVSLSQSIETLLSTPSPAATTQSSIKATRSRTRPGNDPEAGEDEELGVWNQSRTNFINWVAGKQSSTIGGINLKDTSGTGTGKGKSKEGEQEEGEEIGSKGDAKVSWILACS